MYVLTKHILFGIMIVAVLYTEWRILVFYLVATLVWAVVTFPALSSGLYRKAKRGKAGYIYAFYDVGSIIPAIKIGRERVKGSRLASHRTAAPLGIVVLFNVAVPDAVAAEKYLHNRYDGQRLRKRYEWFIATPRLVCDCALIFLLME